MGHPAKDVNLFRSIEERRTQGPVMPNRVLEPLKEGVAGIGLPEPADLQRTLAVNEGRRQWRARNGVALKGLAV